MTKGLKLLAPHHGEKDVYPFVKIMVNRMICETAVLTQETNSLNSFINEEQSQEIPLDAAYKVHREYSRLSREVEGVNALLKKEMDYLYGLIRSSMLDGIREK